MTRSRPIRPETGGAPSVPVTPDGFGYRNSGSNTSGRPLTKKLKTDNQEAEGSKPHHQQENQQQRERGGRDREVVA